MTHLNITKLLQTGTLDSFQYLHDHYAKCLELKAAAFQNTKSKADLIQLDGWLHTDLPLKIKARHPDPHITHDELISIIKWKLLRTCIKSNVVNSKNLKNLIIMNSPRLVINESRKAFKVLMKKNNVQMAVSYLCNLKGITLTTATLIISLLRPLPYMSEECIESIPEIYSLNYTVANYNQLTGFLDRIIGRIGGDVDYRYLEHVIWVYNILLVNKAYDTLLGIPVKGEGGPTSPSTDSCEPPTRDDVTDSSDVTNSNDDDVPTTSQDKVDPDDVTEDSANDADSNDADDVTHAVDDVTDDSGAAAGAKRRRNSIQTEEKRARVE